MLIEALVLQYLKTKLDMSEMERQWEDFFKDINENFKLVYEDLDATMENLANKKMLSQCLTMCANIWSASQMVGKF